MGDPVVDSILNQYFRRLELALARVPSELREQIIEEIREHVDEALAALPEQSDVAVLEILDRVGSPKEIAREAMVGDERTAASAWVRGRWALCTVGVTLTALVAVIVVGLGGGSSAAISAETVAPTASVGGFPTGVAVDRSTSTVYVASGAANRLSIINGRTCNAGMMTGCRHVASASTAGQDPIGVVVDEYTQTIYAVNGGSGSVAVINAATCNARDTAGCSRRPTLVQDPGGPEFLALNAKTNTIYVANTSAGTVTVINGTTCNARVTSGCVDKPATVPGAAGAFPIAVHENTNTVYAGTNNGLAIIDGRTCDSADTTGCAKTPATMTINNSPAGIAIDGATHTAYVSGQGGTVAIVDIARCNAENTSGCGASPRTVTVGQDARGDMFDPASNTVYVTNAQSGTVSMLNATACNATHPSGCGPTPRSFPVGQSPRRLAMDWSTGNLYVVNVLDNTVSVMRAHACNAGSTSGCPSQSAARPQPAGTLSGPGASGGPVTNSSCSPTTTVGSSSASLLMSSGTHVASGTIEGHAWSLWSKKGEKGANGLEDGGVIVNGTAHGVCPGYPNPAELEMLDPPAGSSGIVYGVVGYPGSAKVNVYDGTVGSFKPGKLLVSPHAQMVNRVAFFIGALPQSACAYRALELNTTSKHDSAEHNLGFGTCTANQLVPITASQGIWQTPPGHFPAGFGSGGGGGGGGRLSRTGPDFSSCSPPTNADTSGGQASTITTTATQVASGTVGGHTWSLWSKHGEKGSGALENAGLVLDGKAYGLCPGFPNPAELEMINPGANSNGIVFGIGGYTGPATVKVSHGTLNTFNAGKLLLSQTARVVDGTSFFIGELPASACSYSSLELDLKAGHHSSQHNFGFGTCTSGKLVQITDSTGSWSGP